MIEFCGGKYSAYQDKYQWVLRTHYMSIGKDGIEKDKFTKTFHPSVVSMCCYILDRESGKCSTVEELLDLLVLINKDNDKYYDMKYVEELIDEAIQE